MNMVNYLLMKNAFPIHGIFGIFLLIISEIFLFKKVEPVYGWFFCFAWWSYILILDAVIYRLKGNSLLVSRKKEFFLMIPWSVFIWLVFEAANFALQNWYYINLPNVTTERWAGYMIAYGTVLPGIFETTEFLETVGLFKNASTKKTILSEGGHTILAVLGVLCLLSSVLMPQYFFPFLWVGFAFLLEPFNYRYGTRSFLRDIENGDPRKLCLLLAAGLICGFLWEFWNFWARSKWVYTVPFFDELKGFEMPLAGFLGFPPFAVQAYVIYQFISLFRSGRGWEESTYSLRREKRTRPLTMFLTALLWAGFAFPMFGGIDLRTVDSYYPRLQDAYWIESRSQKELPKVGITTLEELISKTEAKKERDELALRLLVPKEEMNRWVEMTRLVLLKGLGVENLKRLEQAGVHSVSALAAEDPERLYGKLGKVSQGGRPPRKAKIKVWIKEARSRGNS
jgi:hypothetical protein